MTSANLWPAKYGTPGGYVYSLFLNAQHKCESIKYYPTNWSVSIPEGTLKQKEKQIKDLDAIVF